MNFEFDLRNFIGRTSELTLFIFALVFTVPSPSSTTEPIPYLPAGAFAITCFTLSRIIAWRRRKENPIAALAEVAVFAIFSIVNYIAAHSL